VKPGVQVTAAERNVEHDILPSQGAPAVVLCSRRVHGARPQSVALASNRITFLHAGDSAGAEKRKTNKLLANPHSIVQSPLVGRVVVCRVLR
jgi:hypothetical protein